MMDYTQIIQAADVTEKSSVSRVAQNFYVPKKDNKEILLEIQDEIQKAKAFLSIPSPTINVTLFDHLAAVLAKIIREKVDNAVDIIEDISQTVKSEKYSKAPIKTALIEKSKSNEKLLKYVKDMQDLFKSASACRDVNLDLKRPEDDEEEPPEEEDIQDEDLAEEEEAIEKKEELSMRKVMPDLFCHMHYFREAGVGLNCSELLRINMSLKTLALDFEMENLRFWGKVFGTENDYYIAETPFKESIKQGDFGWRSTMKEPEETIRPESQEDESVPEEEEADADNEDEDEETEEPVLKYVVIPPVPPLKLPTPDFPPADENGTGVNKNLYFVCTQPGCPWVCLPRCFPEQIIAARQTKKFLSGKLNAEVRGYPLFPGKEAHYLRAQIARISSGTIICPKNYFHIPSVSETVEEEEEEETAEAAEEETPVEPEKTSETIKINPDYEALSVDEIFVAGTEQWVHERPAVSQKGCSYLNISIKVDSTDEAEEETEAKDETQEETSQEEKPEKEADEESKMEKEKQIPLLRCISQDQCGGGLLPWTVKLCSNLMSELAVLLLRSNVWPGAYTYYSGKSYENVYIGYGQKYSTRHYAPILPVAHPEEYPYGPDIAEHDSSTVPAEEELEETADQQEESES